MSRGINKVFIIGNLGADPEVRYMASGSAVVNISVATTNRWKDKKNGEQQIHTEWHRVVLYNRLGEIAGDFLKKGSKIYIEGFLKTNKWKDKNGIDRYVTEIIANNIEILDSKNFDINKNKSEQIYNKKNEEKRVFDEDIPF